MRLLNLAIRQVKKKPLVFSFKTIENAPKRKIRGNSIACEYNKVKFLLTRKV